LRPCSEVGSRLISEARACHAERPLHCKPVADQLTVKLSAEARWVLPMSGPPTNDTLFAASRNPQHATGEPELR